MYTTKEQVESFIKRQLTTDEYTLFPGLAAAVQSYIDGQIGSSFGTVSASTRYYSGGSTIVDIDPVTDITAVNLVDNEQTLVYAYDLDTEIELVPTNDTVKTYIQKRSSAFPSGINNIAVTGKFSLGTVPDDIKYVATVMIGQLFIEGVKPALVSEGIEGYNRTFAISLASGEISKKKDLIDSILSNYASEDVLI